MRSGKMCAPAMQLYSVAADEVLCKEARIEHEQEKDKDGSASSDGTALGIHMEIKEVNVTGGLNKAEVKRIISGSIPLLEQCTADMQEGTALSYTLVVDAGGRVKEIRADKEHSMEKGTNDCIITLLKQIRFPSSKDTRDIEIRLVLVVKENVKQG